MNKPRLVSLATIVLLPALCAIAACTSMPTHAPRSAGEVIDTVELPTLPQGKTRLDFERDSVVSTRTTDTETITEYRLKGQLYKMVVKPASGAAYTLVDEKGEGKFVRVDGLGTRVAVPMWVLFSW